MLSLEAVSCLETASRQFLGALVLVSGVNVLVLSRSWGFESRSCLVSRQCCLGLVVKTRQYQGTNHFINKFKFKVVTFYLYYSNRPRYDLSIAEKVNCGIHAVVVQWKFKYTHTTCLFIVISNSSATSMLQMTLNFTCPSQRLVFLATSLFLKLLFQMSFLSLAFRSNSRSKLISPAIRRPNNVTLIPVDSARNLGVILGKSLSFLNTFHLFRKPASSIFMIYGVFSILWIALLPLLNCYVSHSL